jgi:streptogramin lyase
LSLETLEDRYMPSVTLFPIPTADSQPMGITRGPDGNVWFAEIHAIGRITPEGQITEYTIGLSPDSEPVEITAGPDGNLWFTEGVTDRIGRITPVGVITEFSVPGTGGRQVFVDGITAGPDGNIWFTEQGGAIGRITPTGIVAVFPTNSAGTLPSQPNLISAGPDGNLWWTDPAGFVGRITPTGDITKFDVGIADPINSQPFGITAGPDGNMWFTESGTDRIGRITRAGVITEFSTGVRAHSVPAQIIAAPDGNLWFSEVGLGQLGRITTAGVVTEFSAAFPAGIAPSEIAIGSDGNIWFTELSGNEIGRFVLPSTPLPAQGGPTTTTLQSSLTTSVVGQAETLTATVISQGGVPTGSVTFLDGNSVLGTAQVNADGQAKLTVSLGVGTHALTASFVGTGDFTASVSPATAVAVDRSATEIALGSSVNPATTGQTVTITAVVFAPGPGGGNPTGTVTLKDGNTVLGTVAIGTTGVATFTTSFATAGSHALTAVYSGDSNFVESSMVLTEQVSAAATTTTLRTSSATAVFGEPVTLTATVNSAAAVQAGTVTFKDGNTVLGTAPVNAAGQATLTVSLGAGQHELTAYFEGTATFASSSSAAVAENVSRAATTVALSPSVNTVLTGRAVTFTATVTAVAPGAGMPTGWVTFKDGDVILATDPVRAGSKASFTTSFAITGGHAVTAIYSGDQNFVGGSRTITEQVNAVPARKVTTTRLFTPANPVLVGQTIILTATVRDPAGTATPTGTVTFFVGKRAVATVRLDATGQARLTAAFKLRGTFTLRAVYSGDGTFAGSWQSVTEQVN